MSRRKLLATSAIVGGGLVAAACAPTTTPKESASAEPAVTTVVNQGTLAPAAPGAAPTGWSTAEAVRGELSLFATFDDSGPAAWNPAAFPGGVVYLTSQGQGYSHRPSASYKGVGFQIINPVTKKVVLAPTFDLGWKQYGTPHGLGTSPDGKWIYFPSTDNTSSGNSAPNGESRLFIVNAKTLKLHQILTNPRWGFHHAMGFKDWQGRDRVLVQANSSTRWILDPNNDNKVVKSYTMFDVGFPTGHAYATVDPTGKFLYVAATNSALRDAGGIGGVAKIDMEKNTVALIFGMHEPNPIGMAHTADGLFTYVNEGHGSLIYKIDNKTNKIVGKTSAGVAGPYGLTLNWDETELWSNGKGEGSHNTGGVIGIIDTKTFSPTRTAEFNQPINIQGSIIDHIILHPDPAVNEMWVSSAGTWETIVVDAASKKVKARIPSPNGGDTHSGAFVRYDADFKGELLIDMGGPQKPIYAMRKEKAAAAAAK